MGRWLYWTAIGAAVLGVVIFWFGAGLLGEPGARISGIFVALSAPFWIAMAQLLDALDRIRANVSITARYYRPLVPKK